MKRESLTGKDFVLKRKLGHSGFTAISAGFVMVFLLVTGCFLFPSSGFHNTLKVSGYVYSAADSTVIAGAAVINSKRNSIVHSDSQGFYESTWTPLTDENSGDQREWLFIVYDVDGQENGSFVSRDTILIEYDPQNITETTFELDFYVEWE